MKYTELENKIQNLLNALKNESDLVQNDEKRISQALTECRKEMRKAKLLQEDVQEKRKIFNELITKVNNLKQQEDYIFESNISLDEKIEKFANATEKTSKAAQELSKLRYNLSNLEEEIVSEEVEKKLQKLLPYWQEINKIRGVEENYSNEDQIEKDIESSVRIVEESMEDQGDKDIMGDVSKLIRTMQNIDDDLEDENTSKRKKFLGIF